MDLSQLALKTREYRSLKMETLALMRSTLGNEFADNLINLAFLKKYALFVGTLEVLGMDRMDADVLWKIVS